MKYIIVYSSITGNTKVIADTIKNVLDEKSCIYFGKPDEVFSHDADVIFVGFWVSKGSCTEEIKRYLETLKNKKIFLFGTAGFGGTEGYFENILTDVKQYIPESNKIIGSFICQGKMPHNVLERYQKLYKEQPENENILNMIANYKNALSHPDLHDVEAVKALVKAVFYKD